MPHTHGGRPHHPHKVEYPGRASGPFFPWTPPLDMTPLCCIPLRTASPSLTPPPLLSILRLQITPAGQPIPPLPHPHPATTFSPLPPNRPPPPGGQPSQPSPQPCPHQGRGESRSPRPGPAVPHPPPDEAASRLESRPRLWATVVPMRPGWRHQAHGLLRGAAVWAVWAVPPRPHQAEGRELASRPTVLPTVAVGRMVHRVGLRPRGGRAR